MAGKALGPSPDHLLAPAVAFAQGSDVRDVMAAVPGVLREQEIDRCGAPSGMAELARPVGRTERTQQNHPTLVKIFKQGERPFDRWTFRVGELGPQLLFVRFDHRLDFRERELEARQRVHVAIGDMVDKLMNGPAAGAIGSLELSGRQTSDSSREARWNFFNLGDAKRPLVGGELFDSLEFANRIAQVRVHESPFREGKSPQKTKSRSLASLGMTVHLDAVQQSLEAKAESRNAQIGRFQWPARGLAAS